MTASSGPANWFVWALLSAVFAAMTAIFAKLGPRRHRLRHGHAGARGDTLVRVVIILFVLGAFVAATGKWIDPRTLAPRTWLFLALSGLATGASWVCYLRALKIGEASQVAPVDKLSVVLVAVFAVLFLGERPLPREWLGIGLVALGVVVLSLRS